VPDCLTFRIRAGGLVPSAYPAEIAYLDVVAGLLTK